MIAPTTTNNTAPDLSYRPPPGCSNRYVHGGGAGRSTPRAAPSRPSGRRLSDAHRRVSVAGPHDPRGSAGLTGVVTGLPPTGAGEAVSGAADALEA
jgi:hypothetical protein